MPFPFSEERPTGCTGNSSSGSDWACSFNIGAITELIIVFGVGTQIGSLDLDGEVDVVACEYLAAVDDASR